MKPLRYEQSVCAGIVISLHWCERPVEEHFSVPAHQPLATLRSRVAELRTQNNPIYPAPTPLQSILRGSVTLLHRAQHKMRLNQTLEKILLWCCSVYLENPTKHLLTYSQVVLCVWSNLNCLTLWRFNFYFPQMGTRQTSFKTKPIECSHSIKDYVIT